jgi:hypothetical protein
MNTLSLPISPYSADLSCRDLRRMVQVVRVLHRLSGNPAYRRCLESMLPAVARFDSGHHAVMMGYDFHLTETGPKLIEVNTDAGGLWYASLCAHPEAAGFSERLGVKLLETFMEDYARFRGDPAARPETLLILDEKPVEQPLYPEMQVFAAFFGAAGIETSIVGPEALETRGDGLYFGGRAVDMIYNRHCDFYLKAPELEKIRSAYLQGQVCLSPNPHVYGLLADKRRMMLWCRPELMRRFGLPEPEIALLAEIVPETRLLASLTKEEAWQTRKQWVFKPDTGYASRGVYVGEKLTKHKLAELDPDNTLLQRWIPPSLTRGEDGQTFKTDYRLFTYRCRLLAMASRLYQGQVTNLRTENGGFAKVRLKR